MGIAGTHAAGESVAKEDRAAVRAVVFHHLAGIALAPTMKALWDRGVFELFEGPSAWIDLDEIVGRTRGNGGYLRVALRLLTSYGWLAQKTEEDQTVRYALTREGRAAAGMAPIYGEAISFIPKAIFLEDFLFGKPGEVLLPSLQAIVSRARERWGIPPCDHPVADKVRGLITRHLDGILVGPAMVALAREGIFSRLESPLKSLDLGSFSGNPASLTCIFDLLATQGWATRHEGRVRLTPRGRYAAQIASAYGVTVSYLPLFEVLSTLLFGNPLIPREDETGVELLVNRGMNVWGSGGAHKTYFQKNEEIIVEIFNRPLDQQPRGICDMGCGDGTLLEHLYGVVKSRTARGRALDSHPLFLIGADISKAARRLSKQRLRRAGIAAFHVIPGDINRPAQLASELEKLDLDIHDLLHVRSFLDHNRPYLPPANYVRGTRKGRSTGAFAHLGEEIPADELEENLVRHLRRWAPYVGRFGLLVLELHTLPPELTAANLDRTPAVAYDGTHGYSDQYPLELDVFMACAREAGLVEDERFQARFPPSELATVSVSFFTAR